MKHVWHADLTASARADLVVSSVGPHFKMRGEVPAQSMDLRILSWNQRTRSWSVTFDAQKVPTPRTQCEPASSNTGLGCFATLGFEDLDAVGGASAPLLDPHAEVQVGTVRFAHLVSRRRDDLVFSATTSYGGSGQPGVLTVVDFASGFRSLAYTWAGEGLIGWHVSHGQLVANAEYWTGEDAHCCPLRSYRFSVAPIHSALGGFVETSDNRPWLGVTVQAKTAVYLGGSGPLNVVGLEPGAPAGHSLQIGDKLLEVLNVPSGSHSYTGFADRLDVFHPGQTVRLLVQRGGSNLTVSVKLGSMKDAIPDVFPSTSPLTQL